MTLWSSLPYGLSNRPEAIQTLISNEVPELASQPPSVPGILTVQSENVTFECMPVTGPTLLGEKKSQCRKHKLNPSVNSRDDVDNLK